MSEAMVRAAVQTGPLAYEIRELPRPRIGDDDGLLRIEACGVCGSDVEQYRGHLVRPGMFPLVHAEVPAPLWKRLLEDGRQFVDLRAGHVGIECEPLAGEFADSGGGQAGIVNRRRRGRGNRR